MISTRNAVRALVLASVTAVGLVTLTGCPDNSGKGGAAPAASSSSATPTTTAAPAGSGGAKSGSGW